MDPTAWVVMTMVVGGFVVMALVMAPSGDTSKDTMDAIWGDPTVTFDVCVGCGFDKRRCRC